MKKGLFYDYLEVINSLIRNDNSLDNRIELIRAEERKYHEACYDNYALFESGSWLYKPVKTVMETLSYMDSLEQVIILDLGCGVGRNSIPMAEALKSRNGKVVCVDLLDNALMKLDNYSKQYGIRDYIETCLSDIGEFTIQEEYFDYIIAVSALEHVASERELKLVLDRMVKGTKMGGYNCIILNTNIVELDSITGIELEPQFELNLSTNQAQQLLTKAYEGWEVVKQTVKMLDFPIVRGSRDVLLRSDCLTFIAHQSR